MEIFDDEIFSAEHWRTY